MICSVCVFSAEKSINGGASLNYKIDDNIRVSAINQVALRGWTADGFVSGEYATERLSASAELELSVERYDHADLDSDDPLLVEPDPSDFDSEGHDLSADLSYAWQRNYLAIHGRYWRDSTLNSQFLDTGLGGLREVEGASYRDNATVRPSWRFQMTQRQLLGATLEWQTVDFESERYVDYDYSYGAFHWNYVLNERWELKVQPLASRYENKANFSVESDTFGVQAGFDWSINEKWSLDVLLGGTRVYTEYGLDGYYIYNPETGQIEFVEIEDQDSNGFTGSGKLSFLGETTGFTADVSSRISPSGDGYLRQINQVRLSYFWKPEEQIRLDFDSRVADSDSTDDRVTNDRIYGEVGFRAGYQFAQNWWLSARYRYRVQEYERQEAGQGRGNLFSVSLSYKLPEEIL